MIVIAFYRQYYIYVTDTRCKRVGMQCWMFWLVIYDLCIVLRSKKYITLMYICNFIPSF